MAYPDKYTRGYGFASYQESHPQSPLPGSQVDVELDAAGKSTAAITAFLQKFARSDGRLANGSVGVDQLAPDLTIGFKAPTTWGPSVLYSLGATVFYLSGFYNCVTAHTSGSSFNPDYWELILDFGSSANAAAASAAAAAASETAAGASETNAATSEANAAASETAAGASKAAAAASETSAATSESNAAADAVAAEQAKELAQAAAAQAAPSPFLPQFGVVGDGAADDTAAWQSWFDYCQANNLPISCPLHIKSKVTDTLAFSPTGVETDGGGVTTAVDLFNVCFVYAGTRDRPVLEIGAVDAPFGQTQIRLPSVVAAGDLTWVSSATVTEALIESGDTAIRIHSAYRVKFDENYVYGFTKGIEYVGCAYSTITGKHILDCKYGRIYTTEGTEDNASFCNENVVLGGRIGCSSAADALGVAFGQVFSWDHDSSYRGQNSNKFYGVCFEMRTGSGTSYRVPVLMDGAGYNNIFRDSRHETGCGPFAICDGGGYANIRVSGNRFHVLFNEGSTTQNNCIMQVNGACGNIYEGSGARTHSWHSGDIVKLITADGATGAYIAGGELFCNRTGSPSKFIAAGEILAHRDAVCCPKDGFGGIGTAVDTTRIKDFRVSANVQPGFTGRLWIFAYDAAGASLGGNATDATWGDEPYVKAVTGIGGGHASLLPAANGLYKSPADGGFNNDCFVTVRAEVKSIHVIYVSGTAELALRSIEITGFATVNTLDALYPGDRGLGGLRVFAAVNDCGRQPRANAKPDTAGVLGFYATGDKIANTSVAAGATPGWVASSNGFLAPAWQASHAYNVPGMLVTNDSGNIYQLKTAGTSASSGGPTGTGTAITDGTCVWDRVGFKTVFVTEAVAT